MNWMQKNKEDDEEAPKPILATEPQEIQKVMWFIQNWLGLEFTARREASHAHMGEGLQWEWNGCDPYDKQPQLISYLTFCWDCDGFCRPWEESLILKWWEIFKEKIGLWTVFVVLFFLNLRRVGFQSYYSPSWLFFHVFPLRWTMFTQSLLEAGQCMVVLEQHRAILNLLHWTVMLNFK